MRNLYINSDRLFNLEVSQMCADLEKTRADAIQALTEGNEPLFEYITRMVELSASEIASMRDIVRRQRAALVIHAQAA